MVHSQRVYVVGISSPTGGGKTTLVGCMAKNLEGAIVLNFDEYDEAGSIVHPESHRTWYENGADYNAWQASRLAADLGQLKSGNTITSVSDGSRLKPTEFILFDAPLGRAHRETGQYIDLMVYVDTPLDVAMARRTLRDYYGEERSSSTEKSEALRRDLESYLEFARDIYVHFVRQMKSTCDLVVDGLLPPDELARQVIRAALEAKASK